MTAKKSTKAVAKKSKVNAREAFKDKINSSNYLSRDLSWLKFNERVLDMAKDSGRSLFDKLKFLAISASNLDEFFTIRVGSLYNYIDYNKSRIDYSGLGAHDFRDVLLQTTDEFTRQQERVYTYKIWPSLEKNGLRILSPTELTPAEQKKVDQYFKNTIFPMLTPMAYDNHRIFPLLKSRTLIFAVVTSSKGASATSVEKISFVQIPKNLKQFFEIERNGYIGFVPIEDIIRRKITTLFRNVNVDELALFRITRNGDFTLEESDDLEIDFIKELERKLKTRRTGRVVRLEILNSDSKKILKQLKNRLELDDCNVIKCKTILDYTRFWELIKHNKFKHFSKPVKESTKPISFGVFDEDDDIFKVLKERDILLHHPYHTFEPVLEILERAAEDPNVLAIKQTIYRLAEDSRVSNALLKAAENGKHVSVLFEVKARFDELNNIRESKRLEKAGAYVIHGINRLKTHTKLLLIVRKEGNEIKRYVHMGSGNYNEQTTSLYTDISLLTSNNDYANDVSEFFNAITGHSVPKKYDKLLTSPNFMRDGLINLINREIKHAKAGKKALIVIKMNSLEDKKFIDALYRASKSGVKIQLIVRGICCIRPGKKGLSENIRVRSIVGDYLEHSRIFYFHNGGEPEVYAGSADAMVRSFDRRIESLFVVEDDLAKKELLNILEYNLKDNTNSYQLNEDGSYSKVLRSKSEPVINVHEDLFHISPEEIMKIEELSY